MSALQFERKALASLYKDPAMRDIANDLGNLAPGKHAQGLVEAGRKARHIDKQLSRPMPMTTSAAKGILPVASSSVTSRRTFTSASQNSNVIAYRPNRALRPFGYNRLRALNL